MDRDYRTLHVERYGEPDSDAGGLGNARCEFNGECSREWSNECECVKDGVCRLESASNVFLEDLSNDFREELRRLQRMIGDAIEKTSPK
jgi:hypothetical protein